MNGVASTLFQLQARPALLKWHQCFMYTKNEVIEPLQDSHSTKLTVPLYSFLPTSTAPSPSVSLCLTAQASSSSALAALFSSSSPSLTFLTR